MRIPTTRILVGLGGTGVALLATAAPAFAVGQFLSPANGFTFPVNAAGNPTRQDVKTTNFPIGLVFIEACDGKSPAARGYDAALDCDNTTAPAPVSSTGPTFVENFTTANADRAAMAFRGAGGSGTYNCLAPEDVKPGTGPKADGSVTPIGPMTKNGNVIDLSVPSWSNCQIRVSSNNASNTQDQAYITYVLPNTGPGPVTPEVPLAVILPLGAAALFAGGLFINRRRRTSSVAA